MRINSHAARNNNKQDQLRSSMTKKKQSKALVKLPEAKVPRDNTAETLISQAIDKNVSVESMEKLLAMRRELEAEWARKQYNSAMSAFQADLPVIKKTKVVLNKDGRTERYRYAPLDSIIAQVQPFLDKHGFNHREDASIEGKFVTARCILSHRSGHSETGEFAVPIDPEAYMNDAQKYASALTFAKRYAFCNVTGVMTGDADTDVIEISAEVKRHSRFKEYEATKPETDAKAVNDLAEVVTYLTQHKIPADFLMALLKQQKLITEDVQKLEHVQPGILRRINNENTKANLLAAWAKQKEWKQKVNATLKEEPSPFDRDEPTPKEVRTNEGDQSRTPTVRQPVFKDISPADLLEQSGYANWRKVKVHFGDHAGRMLGSLSAKVLKGWMKWKPEPYKGTWKEPDLLLDAALCLASAELGGAE
jgi:hypothetical protein